MIVYLRHPVHGTKVAVAQAEVDADCANGWEVFVPGESRAAAPPSPSSGDSSPATKKNTLHLPKRN